MACVNGCKPNAHADERKQARRVPTPVAHDRIDGGDQQVGSVKARHSGEDIGILAIDAVEDVQARHGVPPAEAGNIARRVEYRRETIVHGIPRRCGWMDIIAHEANKVDNEKRPREPERPLVTLGKIKVEGEKHGHRNPAQIEQARHEIGCRPVVNGKPFAGDEPPGDSVDAKERLLGIVNAAHVNGVHLIVWQEIETAVDETEQKPRQHV